MKKLVLGVSVLALSGCGWVNKFTGSGHSQKGYNYSSASFCCAPSGGNYAAVHQPSSFQSESPRSVRGAHHYGGGTSVELLVGAEKFTGGNITPYSMETGGTVNKIEYDDAFDTAWRVSGGIAHNIAPKTSLLARGFYKHANANDDEILIFEGAGGAQVLAGFSDLKSYGAEIGFREYLAAHNSGNKFNPYVGATVGMAHLNDLDVVSLNGMANRVEINDSDWVPTASAMAGVDMSVSNRLSVGLETGLRYEGKRDTDRTPTPTSSAFSVPVSLRGRFSF